MYRLLKDKEFSLAELAQKIKAQIVGNPATTIRGICSLDQPKPEYLSFTRENNFIRLKEALTQSNVGALLIDKRLRLETSNIAVPLLQVDKPMPALLELLPLFYAEEETAAGISPKADIDPSARIGENVSIGAFCSIGAEVQIDDGAILYPHVVIYPRVHIGSGAVLHSGVTVREDCKVGPQVVIQNGAIIGADGFGYVPDPRRGLKKVPQVGTVVLKADAEVGANTCIDRATLGETEIGICSKIDNLVQVGHNVRIGNHSIVCGQTGIAGSVTIGNRVTLGGHVGVADHCNIADDVRVAGASGVITDIKAKGDYAGFPAVAAHTWRRNAHAAQQLPQLIKQIKDLQKRPKQAE